MVELKFVEDCIFWRVVKTCLKKVIKIERGPFKPFILQALLEQYKKCKLVSVNNPKNCANNWKFISLRKGIGLLDVESDNSIYLFGNCLNTYKSMCKYYSKQGVLYTMALPFIWYQQWILYDKLVTASGFFLKIKCISTCCVFVRENLSWFF
jgi:hypothetical protein